MSSHSQPALRIERHAIRTWLRAAIRNRSLVPTRLHENTDILPRRPLPDAITRNLREKQITGMDPNRTFGPFESFASRNALNLRIRSYQPAEIGRQPFHTAGIL